jgi:hypothetical protein
MAAQTMEKGKGNQQLLLREKAKPSQAKPGQAKPSQAKPSQAKVLTGGGDLREAQVDVPLVC